MTPDQLTGRALDEAAARAMGFRIEEHSVYDADGKWRGTVAPDRCYSCGSSEDGWPTEREMLAWLHGRGLVNTMTRKEGAEVYLLDDARSWMVTAKGTDLRDAMARLVVAVAAREAKA